MKRTRWKKRLAMLTTGVALQLASLGPPTGCLDAMLRFPTISVGDIDFVQRLGGPSFYTGDNCHDGIDNDGDGLRDAEDPDCRDAFSL